MLSIPRVLISGNPTLATYSKGHHYVVAGGEVDLPPFSINTTQLIKIERLSIACICRVKQSVQIAVIRFVPTTYYRSTRGQ